MSNVRVQSTDSLGREVSTDLFQFASTAELNALRAGIIAGSISPPAEWTKYRVVDGLLGGMEVVWNGEAFSTVHGELLITHKDGGIASKTSTNTDADAVASVVHKIAIPGFLMGKRSVLSIETEWAHTDAATVRHMAIRMAGTVISSKNSPFSDLFPPETATFVDAKIENLSSLVKQYCSSGWGGAWLEIDTATDFDIEFAVSWDGPVANDTLTLQSYKIKLQP